MKEKINTDSPGTNAKLGENKMRIGRMSTFTFMLTSLHKWNSAMVFEVYGFIPHIDR